MHLTRNYLIEKKLVEGKEASKISKNKPIGIVINYLYNLIIH